MCKGRVGQPTVCVTSQEGQLHISPAHRQPTITLSIQAQPLEGPRSCQCGDRVLCLWDWIGFAQSVKCEGR